MRRRKRRKGKDKVVGKENNSIIKHTRIYLSSKEGREAGKPTLCTCSTIKTAGLKVRKEGDEGRVSHTHRELMPEAQTCLLLLQNLNHSLVFMEARAMCVQKNAA